MFTNCSCIAIVSSQSEITEAMKLLRLANIEKDHLSVINRHSDKAMINHVLSVSGVPEGSQHCYQCVLDAGLTLLVVQGDTMMVEQAGAQLEKLNDVDISLHLNTPLDNALLFNNLRDT